MCYLLKGNRFKVPQTDSAFLCRHKLLQICIRWAQLKLVSLYVSLENVSSDPYSPAVWPPQNSLGRQIGTFDAILRSFPDCEVEVRPLEEELRDMLKLVRTWIDSETAQDPKLTRWLSC